MELLMIFCRKK